MVFIMDCCPVYHNLFDLGYLSLWYTDLVFYFYGIGKQYIIQFFDYVHSSHIKFNYTANKRMCFIYLQFSFQPSSSPMSLAQRTLLSTLLPPGLDRLDHSGLDSTYNCSQHWVHMHVLACLQQPQDVTQLDPLHNQAHDITVKQAQESSI